MTAILKDPLMPLSACAIPGRFVVDVSLLKVWNPSEDQTGDRPESRAKVQAGFFKGLPLKAPLWGFTRYELAHGLGFGLPR